MGAPAGSPLRATWNFNFLLNFSQQPTSLADYIAVLYYDFDPASGTDLSSLGSITVPLSLALFPLQGSENLMFNWLSVNNPPFVIPPAGSFNPDASGEYSFALVLLKEGQELGRSAMLVNAVPEPATLSLLGLGVVGLGLARRRS